MKLRIPAWHYRARAVVQRIWGWSPVEQMALLHLDRHPGTIESVATSLSIPSQVSAATIARLMDFGLVEVRMSPRAELTTSEAGRSLIRTGRAMPERTEEREVHVSVVYEKVGHSLFRRRHVTLVQANSASNPEDSIVETPADDPPETDATMAARIVDFVSSMLRLGETFRGVRTLNSVLEPKHLLFNLDDIRQGMYPEGATADLINALKETLKTRLPPSIKRRTQINETSIKTTLSPQQLIIGTERHLECFEQIAASANDDLFVLSTFVATQDDARGKEHRERILRSLESASGRGVRCHLFYGTSLDDVERKNAHAMEEIRLRLLSSTRRRGHIFVNRDTVRSHAKIIAADDGDGGAVALIGSCNWLSSPFSAMELSVELREKSAVAEALDLLRSIIATVSSTSRSGETLQYMAADLRRAKRYFARLPPGQKEAPSAEMTIVYAADHQKLIRKAAHEAVHRFVCCTNKMGASMVPGLLNPAEIAGSRQLNDVRVYYSRYSGPIKRRHVSPQKARLEGSVNLIGMKTPQLHAKFLLWGNDDIVVSSLNWGSQVGSVDNPFDEIGIHFRSENLSSCLLALFEEYIAREKRKSSPAASDDIEQVELGTPLGALEAD